MIGLNNYKMSFSKIYRNVKQSKLPLYVTFSHNKSNSIMDSFDVNSQLLFFHEVINVVV